MRQKVELSSGVIIYTVLVLLAAAGAGFFVYKPGREWLCVVLAVCMGAWLIAALFYMPLSIEVDDKELTINRPLRRKHIPLADIKTVQQMQPTMAERGWPCSGGFFGYWGKYSERDIGNYFAYYGRSSDCFLVRLRNGRQYMLGCCNSAEMVDAIKQKLTD